MAELRNGAMKCADNGGYIVRYDEVTKGSGTYSSMDYKDRQEVFEEGEGDKALARLREVSGHKPAKMKEEKGEY